jgi:c-di-GMP-binding flagellar brake protein YcgR
MTHDQQRDTDRVPILGELHGEVKVFVAMSIKEISRGGAQIETTIPLQVDSLHEFRLTLDDRSVIVKGRIAHCHITDVDQELVTYRAGLEFIELSERVQEAILEFIETIKASRRG